MAEANALIQFAARTGIFEPQAEPVLELRWDAAVLVVELTNSMRNRQSRMTFSMTASPLLPQLQLAVVLRNELCNRRFNFPQKVIRTKGAP